MPAAYPTHRLNLCDFSAAFFGQTIPRRAERGPTKMSISPSHFDEDGGNEVQHGTSLQSFCVLSYGILLIWMVSIRYIMYMQQFFSYNAST